MTRWDWRSAAALLPALGLSAMLVWYFHDRFWWPVDDGVYAYVAQRINAGDVIHRDLIDLHAGYVNLLHALVFRIFGEDLLSLRYPLTVLTIIQAGLAAALVRSKGVWPASAAALIVTAFSFIQFLNPSANWYALFLFFVTTWVLMRVDPTRAADIVLVGFLLGLCFLFRQLSGVFLAMGALTWLLIRPQAGGEGRVILARVLLIIMACGLLGYLWSKGSLAGFFLFGVWPLAILVVSFRDLRVSDVIVIKLLVRLAVGASVAAAPLAAYHLIEGSFIAWLNDCLFTALLVHQQEFISHASFAWLAVAGLVGISAWRNPAEVLNGLLWLALVLSPMLLGLWSLHIMKRDQTQVAIVLRHPLPIMASFFALVAVHYQIPIYLVFAITPVLLSFICLSRPRQIGAVMAMLMLLAVVGVGYQAGQPVSRGLDGIIRGMRVALDAPEGLPRAHLQMERVDQDVYSKLIARIEKEARPNEALFTLPMDPELNFLTRRAAPVRDYGTPLGLRNEADVEDTMARLQKAAPIFVVHRREDKYLTPLSRELLVRIKRLDAFPESFGPFDLYRLPAPAEGDGARIVRE
jgi:hypothetical protein